MLARIGKLETKSGIIETPLLFPVINPTIQPISPETIQETFKCMSLITNAYIIKRHFENTAVQKGIHDLLGFSGVVMTDSGSYQILTYGDVEVTPKEIVQYQENINSDIATILDVPTGWQVTKRYAQQTVDETFRRARQLMKIKTRDDILWVGPVQGGQHVDLVAQSARKMGELPFQIHALGSPTPVMEQYHFDTLVDMIVTAKMNLPLERPLHLFGAGHPFMFALAIALGCDFFDSAAYAIFARGDRYMTEHGTRRLDELRYFPCSCPVCEKSDPRSVVVLPKAERQKMLALHNLYVSFSELKRVKQTIIEGRLWEHLELRAHGHPALLQALKGLKRHIEVLEKHSPVTKKSGLFFFSSLGLVRPEVARHRERLIERYCPPKAKVLLLLPQTKVKTLHKSNKLESTLNNIRRETGNKTDFHICVYMAPFGFTPIELNEIYPLSQYEIAVPPDQETIEYAAKQIADYIMTADYRGVVLVKNDEIWKGKIGAICRQICKRKEIPLTILEARTTKSC